MVNDDDSWETAVDSLADKIQKDMVRLVDNYCKLYQLLKEVQPTPLSAAEAERQKNKKIIEKMQKASFFENIFNKKLLKKGKKNGII